MIWIFMAVALILFVINPGFRKWTLIIAGTMLALGALGIIIGGHP